VSLPSSYRSQRGHIHLLRVLPLVGCRSKTPTPSSALSALPHLLFARSDPLPSIHAHPRRPLRHPCRRSRTPRPSSFVWQGHGWYSGGGLHSFPPPSRLSHPLLHPNPSTGSAPSSHDAVVARKACDMMQSPGDEMVVVGFPNGSFTNRSFTM
jgi:hypothetical protein